jgi:tetratricopeptide (TPR) repeat protein
MAQAPAPPSGQDATMLDRPVVATGIELLQDSRRVWESIAILPPEDRRDALRRVHAVLMSMPPDENVASVAGFFANRLFESGLGLKSEAMDLYDLCARHGRPAERALALSTMGGWLLYLDPTLIKAEERLNELVQMIRSGGVPGVIGADNLMSDALYKLAYIAERRQDYNRAALLTEEALGLDQASLRGAPRILKTMSAARRLGLAGNQERALELVNRALQECPDCGIAEDPVHGIPAGARASWLAERNNIANIPDNDPRFSAHLEDVANDPRLSTMPSNMSILITLGRSYARQGRLHEAAAQFERIAATFDAFAGGPAATARDIEMYCGVLWEWARTLQRMEREHDADVLLLSLINRFPNSPQAQWARNRMEEQVRR